LKPLIRDAFSEAAKAASVGVATVRRLEGSNDQIRGSAETVWKIQKALEDAGVEFISADETKGPGVRLKHRTADKQPRR